MVNIKFPPSDLLGEVIRRLLDGTDIFPDRNKWGAKLGVSSFTLSNWVCHTTTPNPRHLARILNFVEQHEPGSEAIEYFWAHAHDKPEDIAPNRKLSCSLFEWVLRGERENFISSLSQMDDPAQLQMLRFCRSASQMLSGPGEWSKTRADGVVGNVRARVIMVRTGKPRLPPPPTKETKLETAVPQG